MEDFVLAMGTSELSLIMKWRNLRNAQINTLSLGDLLHVQVLKHHLYTEDFQIFLFSLDFFSELQSHPYPHPLHIYP